MDACASGGPTELGQPAARWPARVQGGVAPPRFVARRDDSVSAAFGTARGCGGQVLGAGWPGERSCGARYPAALLTGSSVHVSGGDGFGVGQVVSRSNQVRSSWRAHLRRDRRGPARSPPRVGGGRRSIRLPSTTAGGPPGRSFQHAERLLPRLAGEHGGADPLAAVHTLVSIEAPPPRRAPRHHSTAQRLVPRMCRPASRLGQRRRSAVGPSNRSSSSAAYTPARARDDHNAPLCPRTGSASRREWRPPPPMHRRVPTSSFLSR